MRRRPLSTCRLILALVLLASGLVAGGCYTIEPVMSDDLVAFQKGVDGVLTVGMPYKEARRALKQSFPQPSLDTEIVAAVPTRNKSMQARRFMIGWPTTTPGTTMVLTMFCDREMNVMRWTAGPVKDDY